MLKLISFLYHDMIAKRKKEKRKENAREAHLKRRMLMLRNDPKENGMKEKIVYKIKLPRLGKKAGIEWQLLMTALCCIHLVQV